MKVFQVFLQVGLSNLQVGSLISILNKMTTFKNLIDTSVGSYKTCKLCGNVGDEDKCVLCGGKMEITPVKGSIIIPQVYSISSSEKNMNIDKLIDEALEERQSPLLIDFVRSAIESYSKSLGSKVRTQASGDNIFVEVPDPNRLGLVDTEFNLEGSN